MLLAIFEIWIFELDFEFWNSNPGIRTHHKTKIDFYLSEVDGDSLPSVNEALIKWKQPGGTDLEKGYGDVRPWRPPFYTSPVVCKSPIWKKKKKKKKPFILEKNRDFGLYCLNFCPNFSSQAPKFCHFSSQDLSFRGKTQFASPTLRKSGLQPFT